MTANPYSRTRAFSWTEILVLVAVLGFLGAVLIPQMDRTRSGVRRTTAASNLRQIGQASLIYANDNSEQLPGMSLNQMGMIHEQSTTPNIHAIAAALALQGGLNDGKLWLIPEDRNPGINQHQVTTVLDPSKTYLDPEFAASAVSFQVVAGLDFSMPSTTPIGFTRGLQRNGYWVSDRDISVFGSDGGHIVFLGGNVNYYRSLPESGGLPTPDGSTLTKNILETIDTQSYIFSNPPTDTGALDGMPGWAVRQAGMKAP